LISNQIHTKFIPDEKVYEFRDKGVVVEQVTLLKSTYF